jgi:hypothetical protein
MTDTEKHELAMPFAGTLVKVPFEGNTVDAFELTFEIEDPRPFRIKVSDGSIIELEQQVTRLYRLIEKKKEDGSPIYMLTGGTKISIAASKPDQGEA